MRDTDKELLDLLVRKDIPREDIDLAKGVLETCPDVAETLANPLVTSDEKEAVINKLFPLSMGKFFHSAVKEKAVDHIPEILEDYIDILIEKQGSIKAVVRYVTPLTEVQQADLKKFIMERFVKEDVDIEYRQDPDLIGGFILNAGDVLKNSTEHSV